MAIPQGESGHQHESGPLREAVHARETEIKYEATAGFALPSFDELPQVARTREARAEQLDAEYFDTRDLRLIRAGITLRRREGGHDAGWHLKLPAGRHTRMEIRLPPGQQEVPEELARLVRVHSRAEQLRPVARISTRRRRLLLLDGTGASLAEVASDQVTAQADSAAPTSWHEVEVELTGGDADVLAAADRLLRQVGVDRASQQSKLARALGLPPSEPPRYPAGSSAPAGQVILGYIQAQISALTALDPMVRSDAPDAVHQMRTTIRRLRSALLSFGSLFGSPVIGPVGAELRWLGGVLGEVRDAEVLATHLTGQVGQMPAEEVVGPVMSRVRGHFGKIGADAQARVLAALDSPRYFALLDQLDLLMSAPSPTARAARPAKQVLPAAVRTAYAQARRRMKRARRAPAGERRDLALHRARKAAKRARYAAEAVTPSFGSGARRFARQMQRVQSVLGDHQDAVIARQVVRDLGMSAHLAGENAFSYGLMYERDGRAAERQRKRGRKAWRKASLPRYRRWLR